MKRDKEDFSLFITLLFWFEKDGSPIHLRDLFWICFIS